MNNKRITLLGLGTIGQVVFDELVASTNGAWQLAWVLNTPNAIKPSYSPLAPN